MSVTDDLLGGSSYKPTAPAPQETYRGSVTDEFLSISPRAGTETFKSLTDPTAISDPRMSAGAGTAFMGGIPTKKQDAIKARLAQEFGLLQ